MLQKPFNYLVSAYVWSFFLITALPLFLVFCLVWLVTLSIDPKRIAVQRYTGWWTRMYLFFNPGWTVSFSGLQHSGRQPVILVANHQSILDVALMLQLPVPFRWVYKKELSGIPVLGWVIALGGHIGVERGNKESVLQMSLACKQTIAKGVSVCMFPEGTRSRHRELMPFKPGAFILAKESETPLLAVVITGAEKALPKKGVLFGSFQHMSVKVLEQIPAERVMQLNLEDLIEYTWQVMDGELHA